MAKLFSLESEDFKAETKPVEQLIEAKIENSDIPNIIEFHEDAIQVAIEGVSKANNELYILQQAKASLESKKRPSVEYFTSIENYSLYMKSIANNLGVKAHIPSMEDFKNPYGTEASHKIVMEGFVEFIRSIWEKIKSFFRDFFKRILLFFKRLTNADLQMEEYEMYIEDLMHKVRKSNKSTAKPIKVDSKLPVLLAGTDINYMRTDYLLTKGKQKMDNLVDFINKLFNEVDHSLIKNFERNINGLKDGLESRLITADVIDNIRNDFVEMFKKIFTIKVDFRSLPDEVQSDILSAFTTLELSNSDIYSIIPDRDINSALPKNFNIYYVAANVHINEESRTSKLFICSNTEGNSITESKLETISSRENLLRLYDFYKKFNKEIKIERLDNIIHNFENRIDKAFGSIKSAFSVALESDTGDQTDDIKNKDQTGGVSSSASEFDNKINNMQSSQGLPIDDGKQHKFSNEIRAKLNDLHKFIINMLNVIQVLLKEMAVGLLGIYQEIRYEMIRYLYKCAKQF